MEDEKLFQLIEKMYNELKTFRDETSARFDTLESDVKGLKEGQIKLENIVTRIEQDHGKKLDTLFDGYVQNADRLDRIENKIDAIEEKVQTQEVEIRVLKNVK